MTPHYSDATVTVYAGDCLDVLAELPDASVDAVVTDPPAGIAFMSREWDDFRRSRNGADTGRDNVFGRTSCRGPEYARGARANFVEWLAEVMTECLRVTKPGGHAFVWAIPRTSHWTATAIEDAGWVIRDRVAHLFGTGFPKSLSVGAAIMTSQGLRPSEDEWTPEAEQWRGYGTALKPATEDWWLARKPLSGTVAANVLQHGTGALNIDATRIHTPGSEGKPYTVKRLKPGATLEKTGGEWRSKDGDELPWEAGREYDGHTKDGRWPANVVLDEHQAAALDQQSGELAHNPPATWRSPGDGTDGLGTYAAGVGKREAGDSRSGFGDRGGASRYFYTAKADAAERIRVPSDEPCEVHGVKRCTICLPKPVAHPTVKPLDLMRWLVRLVTPPGGLVLDPFAGSGTTAEACILERFRCIAIEREPDYLPLITQRINRRRDPAAYVKASGEDGGLFDLLDGEGA